MLFRSIDALQLSWTIDHRLVHVIDSADSFRAEKWEPRPLPTEEHPWPCGPSTVDATRETAHLGMICSPRRGDFGDVRRLGHRVWNESTGPAFRVYVIACALCGMESKAWPDEHGPFKDDADLYAAIARACGLDVSWIAAWDHDPSLPLYDPDGLHPSVLGTYLAALVMYEQLTGKDARALPAVAYADGGSLALSTPTIRLLQEAAHAANVRGMAP